MGKIRRCNRRCHEAKGSRCRCWCSGAFHGVNGAGAANREALAQAVLPEELLKQHGFKEGETKYIHQQELPLEMKEGG